MIPVMMLNLLLELLLEDASETSVSAEVLRSLSIFEYPEMEESLTAWSKFLSEDVASYAQGGIIGRAFGGACI